MKVEDAEHDVNWYREVLDTAPDAMVVVDLDGTIRYVNAQLERLFGQTREDLVGRALDELIPTRFLSNHRRHVEQFFTQPRPRLMGSGLELFGKRRDGSEVALEVSLSPFRAQNGMLVSAAIRDVSARKRAAAAEKELADDLKVARASAEAASAAKSDFLSSMSHELRTPLNAILGFAQLLRSDKQEPLSERHKDRVDEILKGGEHLLRLIDDILDLSRIEAGGVALSIESVIVEDVIREVQNTLEPMASRAGLTLTREIATGLPPIAADRTRFAQILMNYASNSIKYNRPGGRVTFQASLLNDGFVRASVADNGLGIPLAKQGKLFQPFQRAGRETSSIDGTGIGLMITKRLAELMGGRVGFRSEASEGSEFWVDVPALG